MVMVDDHTPKGRGLPLPDSWARDHAAAYFKNGYKPIPADAKAKIPHVSGFYDHYDFDAMWKNWLDCDIALVLDGLVCVDFDRHGASPNGGDYYDMLTLDRPEIFKNSVVETTKSAGVHAYYRWTTDLPGQEWKLPVTIGDTNIVVEVKTGRRLAFCYPSKNYTLLHNNFEETKLSQLMPLPTIFRYYKPAPSVNVNVNVKPKTPFGPATRREKDMTPEQREKAVEIIINIYRRNAGRDGTMHSGAYAMSCYMAGLGYGANDIRRALKSYESHGHRSFRRGELEELCDYGMKNPDRRAIPPWKHLTKLGLCKCKKGAC